MFARYRLDIGKNSQWKVDPTPKDNEPVYAQSLPTRTNLKDKVLVELALMQEYNVRTALPFRIYASLVFAQLKPNGKLRLLVDYIESTISLSMTITNIFIR